MAYEPGSLQSILSAEGLDAFAAADGVLSEDSITLKNTGPMGPSQRAVIGVSRITKTR